MWKPALLLILPLYPMMNFASDQHEHEGSKSSIIGSEGGCETIGGFRSRHSDMHDLDHYMMKGRMYFSCTGDDSDNGAPWCAVQVRADASRTVLRGKWEDCSPECPGYDLSDNFCRNQSQCEMKWRESECDLFTGECHCPPERPLLLGDKPGSSAPPRCVPDSRVGGRCQDDIQCQFFDNNTHCEKSICSCETDFILSQSGLCIQAKKVDEPDQSTIFSFTLLIIPMAVLCCLCLLCVRVIYVIIEKKGSSKTDEAHQDVENGLDDAETFSMTVFNSAKEEEDGHSQKAKSSFEDIIELKEEEEDEGQDVISSKDVQKSALDESIILRKSLRKGEGGMYFEEYLV